MADVRVLGSCEGDASRYVVIATAEASARLEVTCHTTRGRRVPATMHPVELEPSRREIIGDDPSLRVYAIALPLLPAEVTVIVRESGSPEGVRLAKVTLPTNARPRRGLFGALSHRSEGRQEPSFAEIIRGIEYRDWTGRTRVTVTEIWPAGDAVVWRIQVVFATGDGTVLPRLEVLDAEACPVASDPILMEDHVVPAGFDRGLRERVITFSVRLSWEVGYAVMVASLEGVDGSQGFICMTDDAIRRLRGECEARLVDAAGDPGYEHWLDVHRVTARDLMQQREAAQALGDGVPAFGVVIVDTGGPTQAAKASVSAQGYGRWTLAVASPHDGRGLMEALAKAVREVGGDHLVLVDSHDELEPDALWRLAEEIIDHPETDLIYADEDHIRDGHYVAPDLKTFPNLGKLRAYDYLGDLLCVSRSLLEAVGLPGKDVEAAWMYDLALRCFERAERPAHVARVLCHVGDHGLPGAHEAGRVALSRHLARCGIMGTIEDGPAPCTYRVHYALPDPAPLVSVIVPSRDHADLLRACISSILERSTYPRYEVVVVENNSVEASAFELYRELQERDPRVRVVTWQPTGRTEDGFNYSEIVNFGARAARGELLVLLNNDTRVIEAAWMEEMAGCLTRSEVAVVGAKLLFEDGLVQHAGMIANPNCDNAHINQNLWRETGGYDFSATLPSDMNMVTGACQMVRRSTFEEAGGYDENLAVGFNDSEFCLRMRSAGHSVAFTPYALLYHREFSSRGREVYDVQMRQRLLAEKAYVMAKYPDYYAQGDETVNENLDHFSNWFKLRW